MCGIVGYAGRENAANIIYEGLCRLEYRGYDSAGIAVMNCGKIEVEKCVGRVQKLNTYAQNAIGTLGIGHTRWATHGIPSTANAHPHSAGRITVVHNGIIENYATLKQKLCAAGAIFTSSTDSEVIAHIIDYFYDGNLLEAVTRCADMLIGSYALMVMCEGVEEIVVARNRSPAILGLGEGCNFCASDEPALADLCPRICILEDNDFAVITADSVKIFDKQMRQIERPVRPNTAEPQALWLGGFPHYMLKELWEAPAAVKNTVSAFSEVECEVKKLLSGADRIIFTGCGTAYHAALVGKRYIEEFARKSCEAEYAGELRYKSPVVTPNTVLVAVTQSGETADTVEAARLVKALGGRVLAVTNCPRSQITRIADVVVPVCAGTEICVAATKSYSGQITALCLLALTLAEKSFAGKLCKRLVKAPELILKTLEEMDVYTLAEVCAQSRGVYFLGRDIDYAVALEGSLKLKEVSYIPGGGYAASELKHGTLALIDGSTLSVFVICNSALAKKSASAVEQVLSRGGNVAVISSIVWVQSQFEGRAQVVKLPHCDKYISPLISAAALQFIAYRAAVILGRNPDMPRNLAKSVTVE